MIKNPPPMQGTRFNSRVLNIPCRREWQPTPVFLPGEFHRLRSLVGYSPWDHKELDTTEWLTLSLSHCHLQALFVAQADRWVEWGYGGNHSSTSWDVETYIGSLWWHFISVISPGIEYYFWFTIIPGGGSSICFYLNFSTIIAPTQQVGESVWGLHQLQAKLFLWLPSSIPKLQDWVQSLCLEGQYQWFQPHPILFLPLLSITLIFHSHINLSDFCLRKLQNQYGFIGM